MKKDVKVWMPLYIGDWDADTRHLSAEEDGCYFRLIRSYWRNGAPLDDDDDLANIVGMSKARWLKFRPKLARFFDVTNGRWVHGKVESIRAEWQERRDKAEEKARKAAAARYSKDAPSSRQALHMQCPSPSSATLGVPTEHPSASGQVRFSNLEFRAKAVERMGHEWVASWLDPAEWRDIPTRAIVARNGISADKIRRELFPLLADIAVEVRSAAA